MDVLLTLVALLSLLSFLLKCSFFPRGWTAVAALALALAVRLAIPWLVRQPAGLVADWTSTPGRMLDGAVCIVLEAVLMMAFCFGRPSGRLRLLSLYPGLLVFPAACWGWDQLLFARPGIHFDRFAWIAALVTLAVAFGGSRLLARLVPDEATRLEGLFLINLFLLLLCVAATGAITF